MVEYHSYY